MPKDQNSVPPSGAEVIPDVEAGGSPSSGEVNEIGLTAEEQAEFDAMRTGEADSDGPADLPPPADGEQDPPGDDPNADPADDPNSDPDPSEAGDTPPAAGKPAPKSVSYGKYQRETTAARKRAQAAEERRAQLEADNIKLGERLRIINEALAAQAAAPPPAAAPDPNQPPENPFEEEDVDATVDYAKAADQMNRRMKYLAEAHNANATATSEDRESREMLDHFTRDAQSYSATEEGKHFGEAYAYLKDMRLRQIGVGEFNKDPADPNAVFTEAEIARMVAIFNSEEKWLVGKAINERRSPAAAVMLQANLMGFKPSTPAPAQADPPAPAQKANGAAAPAAKVPAPTAPPARNVAAEIDALAKARDDGRSLSDGGAAPAQGITMEGLLRMSDAEFADYVDTLPAGKLDEIMGRQHV